jgi:hypothetical protein
MHINCFQIQLLTSPLHIENPSSSLMPGSTGSISSGPFYEYPQRSCLGENGQIQQSGASFTTTALNQETYEASISHLNPPLLGKPWRTGYHRNVPRLGIGSLLLVLSSRIASAILLDVSDGNAALSWRVAPSVVLASYQQYQMPA